MLMLTATALMTLGKGCQTRGFGLKKHLRAKLQKVRKLIDEGVDFDALDSIGFHPLTTAVLHEEREICELLLENGAGKVVHAGDANPRTFNHKLFLPPMGAAAMLDDSQYLILLIDRGIDLDAKGWGHAPLLIAACWGNLEAYEILLAAGSKWSQVNRNPFSLLECIENGMAPPDVRARMLAIALPPEEPF